MNSSKNLLSILAVLFAILFVFSTAASFVLFNVERSVFDAQLYLQAMDEANVYVRLPELTARALAMAAQNPGRTGLLSVLRNLSEEEWRTMVVGLLPPDLLRTLTEDAVTQILAVLNDERQDAVLNLAGLKAHLQSSEGVNAVYMMLETQPDCTLEQLTAMTLGQQALTLCNPPDTFLFIDLRPIVESEIRAGMSLIPEQISLISAGPERVQTLRDLNAIRLFMRLSPLVPLVCLLIVTILAVRSIRSWLVWWGYSLLSAGLVSMVLSALSGPVASLTFQIFIKPFLPDVFPADIVDVFSDLTTTIVHDALQPVVLWAGVLALIGLVMVTLAFFSGRRLQRPPVNYRQL